MKPSEKEEAYGQLTKEIAQAQDSLQGNKQRQKKIEAQSQEIARLGRLVDRELDEMEGQCKNGERARLIRQTRDDHQSGRTRLHRSLEQSYETLNQQRRALQRQEDDAIEKQKRIKSEKGSRP